MFMSWNRYPSLTRNSIIKRLKTSPNKVETEKDDRKIIWIRSPYLGKICNNMTKNCFKKVQKCSKENIRLITCYETKETEIFFQLKIAFQYTKNRYLQSHLSWL